jgi:hypothetical protein
MRIWWPSEISRNGWKNVLKENNKIIEEYNINEEKNIKHLENIDYKEQRIVFYHYKDLLGFTKYEFVGLYRLNENKTEKQKRTIWQKYRDEYKL